MRSFFLHEYFIWQFELTPSGCGYSSNGPLDVTVDTTSTDRSCSKAKSWQLFNPFPCFADPTRLYSSCTCKTGTFCNELLHQVPCCTLLFCVLADKIRPWPQRVSCPFGFLKDSPEKKNASCEKVNGSFSLKKLVWFSIIQKRFFSSWPSTLTDVERVLLKIL